MSTAGGKPVDDELVRVATCPAAVIGLGDDAGHLGQHEVGNLRTSLLVGDAVGEDDVGSPPDPLHLAQGSRDTHAAREAGATCARPIPPLAQG
jgi:hypothetical protein